MQVWALSMATVLTLGLVSTIHAEPKLERVAFQFTGDCTAQHRHLLNSLSTIEGVHSIDLTSIPDHVLVDVDERLLFAHDLAPIVRRMLSATSCHAERMESCISATFPSHRAGTSPPGNGHDRSR